MQDIVQRVTKGRITEKAKPKFKAGDTIEVSVKVKEGEKERTQVFKGVVIRIQGSGASKNFTVRKVSDGVGVERIFPFASPSVEKVKIISSGTVRRSRLYYLRGRKGKSARIAFELVREEDSVAKPTAE
jgi:large subunit ribosomal protein L19